MADTFCPECGTVFEDSGVVCPNCAAVVGMRPPPKPGGGISVMPLAKDSGGRKGFMAIDGADLQLRDRTRTYDEGVGGEEPVQVSSGLAMEDRAPRAQQQLAPDPPPEPAAASGGTASGGIMKPLILVIALIALAVGGKLAMDFFKQKSKPAPAAVDDE